jgi:hypothetical protein
MVRATARARAMAITVRSTRWADAQECAGSRMVADI